MPQAIKLLGDHQQFINIGSPCPEEYRTSQDLTISKDAAVAITLLGGNTGWSNSIGYYYYRESDGVPTDRSQIHPILIVPNTQDGEYNSSTAKKAKGIDRGTTVQLYFYGFGDEFAESKKNHIFPQGTKIGFILKSHAWNDGNCWNCDANHTDAKGFFSTSTPKLNTKGKATTGSGVAMFTPDGENLLISFEDHNNDQNFSDVVFTMSTNPVGSFTDVNVVKDKETVKTIQMGVYAFEDLWPSKGDYDMNDVVVEASAEKTIARDITKITVTGNGGATKTDTYYSEKYIQSETFIYVPHANYAVKTNGLAFKFIPSEDMKESNISRYALTIGGKEANVTYDATDKVFYLTDNVEKNLGQEFRLSIEYKTPVWNEASKSYSNTDILAATAKPSKIQPFIYRKEGDKNWEVHIPYEAPTSKMDLTYFDTEDDKSTLNGIYYVRTGNYPFAFYMAGANSKDIDPLLKKENERKPIDELYPDFIDWATSKGAQKIDWYILKQ